MRKTSENVHCNTLSEFDNNRLFSETAIRKKQGSIEPCLFSGRYYFMCITLHLLIVNIHLFS